VTVLCINWGSYRITCFKECDFVISCTHDIDRPGFFNSRLKNFRENASNSKPMSCYFKNQTFCFSFRFFFNKETVVHQVFSPLQGKVPKEIHAILTKTLREHAPLYATVKNWVA
jgi:hypothetical protein